MSTAEFAPDQPMSTFAAFRAGFMATWTSVFTYVLLGNYAGIGAISHDFGFSIAWTLIATILVWAGPAQVILVSTLGAGASLLGGAYAANGRYGGRPGVSASGPGIGRSIQAATGPIGRLARLRKS